MATKALHGGLFIALLAGVFASNIALAKEVMLRTWPDKTPTPALTLTDISGREWDLEDLRGKVVVLNFWASWCAPCVDEIPVLNKLADSAGLVVLGVNYKESMAAIQRFSKDHPMGFPILRDRTGDAFKQWSSGVMPTTVLIDKDGRARWRIAGELSESDPRFRKVLDELLKQ